MPLTRRPPRWLFPAVLCLAASPSFGQEQRARVRELDIEPGVLPPGPLIAITDVAGVRVGHRTLLRGESVRTASRKLPDSLGGWTVGALVQSNFGGVLSVDGLPLGERLGRYAFRDSLTRATALSGDSGHAAEALPLAPFRELAAARRTASPR